MPEIEDGGGHMTEVMLRPRVFVTTDSDTDIPRRLRERAHRLCFIASSVNFPVRCKLEIVREGAAG